jgi:hypothetical protein
MATVGELRSKGYSFSQIASVGSGKSLASVGAPQEKKSSGGSSSSKQKTIQEEALERAGGNIDIANQLLDINARRNLQAEVNRLAQAGQYTLSNDQISRLQERTGLDKAQILEATRGARQSIFETGKAGQVTYQQSRDNMNRFSQTPVSTGSGLRVSDSQARQEATRIMLKVAPDIRNGDTFQNLQRAFNESKERISKQKYFTEQLKKGAIAKVNEENRRLRDLYNRKGTISPEQLRKSQERVNENLKQISKAQVQSFKEFPKKSYSIFKKASIKTAKIDKAIFKASKNIILTKEGKKVFLGGLKNAGIDTAKFIYTLARVPDRTLTGAMKYGVKLSERSMNDKEFILKTVLKDVKTVGRSTGTGAKAVGKLLKNPVVVGGALILAGTNALKSKDPRYLLGYLVGSVLSDKGISKIGKLASFINNVKKYEKNTFQLKIVQNVKGAGRTGEAFPKTSMVGEVKYTTLTGKRGVLSYTVRTDKTNRDLIVNMRKTEKGKSENQSYKLVDMGNYYLNKKDGTKIRKQVASLSNQAFKQVETVTSKGRPENIIFGTGKSTFNQNRDILTNIVSIVGNKKVKKTLISSGKDIKVGFERLGKNTEFVSGFSKKTLGEYNPEKNLVSLNKKLLKKPDLLKRVAYHEMLHEYSNKFLNKYLTTEQNINRTKSAISGLNREGILIWKKEGTLQKFKIPSSDVRELNEQKKVLLDVMLKIIPNYTKKWSKKGLKSYQEYRNKFGEIFSYLGEEYLKNPTKFKKLSPSLAKTYQFAFNLTKRDIIKQVGFSPAGKTIRTKVKSYLKKKTPLTQAEVKNLEKYINLIKYDTIVKGADYRFKLAKDLGLTRKSDIERVVKLLESTPERAVLYTKSIRFTAKGLIEKGKDYPRGKQIYNAILNAIPSGRGMGKVQGRKAQLMQNLEFDVYSPQGLLKKRTKSQLQDTFIVPQIKFNDNLKDSFKLLQKLRGLNYVNKVKNLISQIRANSQKIKTIIVSKNRLKIEQVPKQINKQINLIKQTYKLIQEPILKQTQRVKQVQTTKQILKLKPITRTFRAKRFRVQTTEPVKVPVKLPRFRFGNKQQSTNGRLGLIKIKQGNKVYTFRTGLTFNRANALAGKIVDNNKRASFEVKAYGRTTQRDIKPYVNAKFRLKKSKNPLVQRFVEKRKYRIDTRGEKQDLSISKMYKKYLRRFKK